MEHVFINCPFDDEYQPLFRALVFAVMDCGFFPRCALERDDGSETRIEKIRRIIGESEFGLHDISRTELDAVNGLPRFNMPLELGIYLGARYFGRPHGGMACVIFDRERYRHQKFCTTTERSSGSTVELPTGLKSPRMHVYLLPSSVGKYGKSGRAP